MTGQDYYKGVEHVVHISTNVSKTCEFCAFSIDTENFDGSINHYISDHGYKLLHVGQETHRDLMGHPLQVTVAVLGK